MFDLFFIGDFNFDNLIKVSSGFSTVELLFTLIKVINSQGDVLWPCKYPSPQNLFIKNHWWFFFYFISFYCCSSTVVSIFPLTCPPPLLSPSNLPPLALSMCPLYMFLDGPSPIFPHYPSSLPSGYCQFVLYFNVSGYILLAYLLCWLGLTWCCSLDLHM